MHNISKVTYNHIIKIAKLKELYINFLNMYNKYFKYKSKYFLRFFFQTISGRLSEENCPKWGHTLRITTIQILKEIPQTQKNSE